MISWKRLLKSIPAIVCTVVLAGGIAGSILGVRAAPVLTGSMRPNYPAGTLAFTRNVKTTDIRNGDVVAFAPPSPYTTPHGLPVMHRVTWVEHNSTGTFIKTRGDNKPAPDPWTIQLTSQSAHELWFALPNLGRITAAVKSTNPETALMAIGGLALIAWSLATALNVRKPAAWTTDGAGTHFREQAVVADLTAPDRATAAIIRFEEPLVAAVIEPTRMELTRQPLLFGSVSHELRTALTHVTTAVELARDEAVDTVEDNGRLNLMNMALSGTSRLTSVCEKLLYAFGLEAYRTETSVGLEKIVHAAVEDFGLSADRVWLTGNPVSSVVLGSEGALQWAISGMLEHAAFISQNASDLMIEIVKSPGKATVIVSASVQDETHNRLKSWQEESSLNLAMVQRAAIDHGGLVAVESKLDGVYISLTLPLIFQSSMANL